MKANVLPFLCGKCGILPANLKYLATTSCDAECHRMFLGDPKLKSSLGGAHEERN